MGREGINSMVYRWRIKVENQWVPWDSLYYKLYWCAVQVFGGQREVEYGRSWVDPKFSHPPSQYSLNLSKPWSHKHATKRHSHQPPYTPVLRSKVEHLNLILPSLWHPYDWGENTKYNVLWNIQHGHCLDLTYFVKDKCLQLEKMSGSSTLLYSLNIRVPTKRK